MTATPLQNLDVQFRPNAKNALALANPSRIVISIAAAAMTLACAYAIMRLVLGIAPSHPNLRSLAIVLHVATVLPAIPLGGFLLLARKGTSLHKSLGKVWIGLMLATATSALFIKTGGSFSFIHLFVPITFLGAWNSISTARKGQIAEHKKHIIGMYLGALMIPGVLAFVLEGRLMNVLAFG